MTLFRTYELPPAEGIFWCTRCADDREFITEPGMEGQPNCPLHCSRCDNRIDKIDTIFIFGNTAPLTTDTTLMDPKVREAGRLRLAESRAGMVRPAILPPPPQVRDVTAADIAAELAHITRRRS